MRYGQQLCEMLNMMSGAAGWNRNMATRALSAAYGDHEGIGYDEYGGDEFNNLKILDYHQLHADLAASLTSTGCDTDSDGDGILDCSDGCPLDGDKTDPGACGCGVDDTDGDGDGTPDCSDGCPADGDKNEPGVCGCGVVDTDSDMDGIPDCNDDSSGGGGGAGSGGGGGGCFLGGLTR